MAAIPQWDPALLPAESKRGRATREMVGAMVKGPMKRMRKPMTPEKPTSIWTQEATMMAPCNWRGRRVQPRHLRACGRTMTLSPAQATVTGPARATSKSVHSGTFRGKAGPQRNRRKKNSDLSPLSLVLNSLLDIFTK